MEGSSPRTRGARATAMDGNARSGIIPAYAGSTLHRVRVGYAEGDHPRVRGEHNFSATLSSFLTGSSPRTRGAPTHAQDRCVHGGIIPAYAGSTKWTLPYITRSGDHPRVRGEHLLIVDVAPHVHGSSPRTRGAHLTKCIASVIELVLHTVVKVQLTAHCYRFSYLQPYPQLRS